MSQPIHVPLSGRGIEKVIKEVENYKQWLAQKSEVLCERMATLGATHASLSFSRAAYTGIKDAQITVEPTAKGYVVRAEGESVLFVEFGSGITYGSGHPDAAKYGMGPGTYPDGKGHWDDPRGWWLPKEKGGGHTFGNPPAAPMYNAVKTIESQLKQIVKEVFS